MAPLGTINSSGAQYHRRENFGLRGFEEQLFGLDEHLAGLALRVRWAAFFYERAIRLAVNARAAHTDILLQGRSREPFDEVLCPLQVNRLVIRQITFAGGNSIHHPIK